MARFPKIPGAGAKAIKNPVYWSRMHLQNERYRATSRDAIERFNERKTRLFNIQNDIATNIHDALIDSDLPDNMTENECSKWNNVMYDMKNQSEWCNDNVDVSTQADLNKLATKLKNWVMYMLKMANKYEAFSNTKGLEYDAKRKMVIFNGEDQFYLGQ